jgi:hypothetical protein
MNQFSYLNYLSKISLVNDHDQHSIPLHQILPSLLSRQLPYITSPPKQYPKLSSLVVLHNLISLFNFIPLSSQQMGPTASIHFKGLNEFICHNEVAE